MKRVFVHGIGAVSPAGWGVSCLRQALAAGWPVPASPLPRPGWDRPLHVRRVPAANPEPAFLRHARLRRTSSISTFAAGAVMEALGNDIGMLQSRRLGILVCVTGGCVQFSRRFYDETWKKPATASPLIFPETVFNAPSSHLSAMLSSPALNYTLVGDAGAFLQAMALAADWLEEGRVDACVVAGSEEIDWLTADALRHFSRDLVSSEGAGAVYLSSERGGIGAELIAITEANLYLNRVSRMQAITNMKRELKAPSANTVLCDSRVGLRGLDADETAAWADWKGARLSPKQILGEGFMAGAAWQCVAAIDAVREKQNNAALVSISGTQQQAIGACFAAPSENFS